jgi:hypothetical protein
MTDATEAIARIRRTCSLPYPDNHSPYSTNFEFGTMRAILAHIDALTETAERNKWMCEVMDAEVVKQKTTIDAQAAEIERLRVERDTLKADSEMLVMYGKKIKALRAERDDILHRLDAVIAQADAALGSEG